MDAALALEHTIVALFEHERLYAELIAEMDRSFRVGFGAVAGVSITDRINLTIDPVEFVKLPLIERVDILKHECEHILRDHIPRMKEYAPEVYETTDELAKHVLNHAKHRVLNIAADLPINGGLKNLPTWGCFPKNFDLPPGETFEWYMEQLKDNDKLKDQKVDGHSMWGESTGSLEAIRARIKQAINAAGKRTKAAGKLTGDQQLMIDKLNASQVTWRTQLRRFMAKSGITNVAVSRTKRHRRYGITQPGQIKTPSLHLAVALDTSGSVSDEALVQFISELKLMSKYAKLTVVNADSEIKGLQEYDSRKAYTVEGRGGTAYKPVFDFFNKYHDPIDGLIYFGDGDCYDTAELQKPKYPTIWVLVGDQKPPATFGSVIRIKE